MSIVHIQGEGAIDVNDVHTLLNDLATSGAVVIPVLVDLRDATLRFFPAEIQACMEHRILHQAQYGTVRCATIASDHATYGVLYMYQRLSAGRDPSFGVFLTLSKAMEWLQQDEEQ